MAFAVDDIRALRAAAAFHIEDEKHIVDIIRRRKVGISCVSSEGIQRPKKINHLSSSKRDVVINHGVNWRKNIKQRHQVKLSLMTSGLSKSQR
jgi:hypothetical protein